MRFALGILVGLAAAPILGWAWGATWGLRRRITTREDKP